MNISRNISIIIGIVILCSLVIAGPKKKFGKSLTLKKTTPISSIIESPNTYKGKKLLVEGTITDVCTERGCWIDIASDKEGQTLRFKVQDGVISFPVDVKGKHVRAEGILSVKQVAKKKAADTTAAQDKKSLVQLDAGEEKDCDTYLQLQGIGAEVK